MCRVLLEGSTSGIRLAHLNYEEDWALAPRLRRRQTNRNERSCDGGKIAKVMTSDDGGLVMIGPAHS